MQLQDILRRRPWRVAGNVAFAGALAGAAVLPVPPDPGVSDVTLHACAYGVQSGLLLWLLDGLTAPRAVALVAFLGSTALGALTELAQGLSATRHAELSDLVADALGVTAVIGAWLMAKAVLRAVR